jgi:hypothetical protein
MVLAITKDQILGAPALVLAAMRNLVIGAPVVILSQGALETTLDAMRGLTPGAHTIAPAVVTNHPTDQSHCSTKGHYIAKCQDAPDKCSACKGLYHTIDECPVQIRKK